MPSFRRKFLTGATLGLMALLAGAAFLAREELASRFHVWRLGSAEASVRGGAIEKLGELGRASAVGPLAARLADPEEDAGLREGAALALLRSETGGAALAAAFPSLDTDLGEGIFAAVARERESLRGPELEAFLVPVVFRDDRPKIREEALLAIEGAGLVAQVLERLDRAGPGRQHVIYDFAARDPLPSGFVQKLEALVEEDLVLGGAVTSALVDAGLDGLPGLERALSSAAPPTRAAAARGLVRLVRSGSRIQRGREDSASGLDARVARSLASVLDDGDYWVRAAAVLGLEASGAHALPYLGRLLQALEEPAFDPPEAWLRDDSYHNARARLARFLGKLAQKHLGEDLAQVQAALVERIGDREPAVRRAAVESLGLRVPATGGDFEAAIRARAPPEELGELLEAYGRVRAPKPPPNNEIQLKGLNF